MIPYTAPKPASTRGPKILTFSGVAVAVAGIIALVFAIMTLFGNLPTSVMTPGGVPGKGAITGFNVPDGLALDSPGGMSYDIWEVQPAAHAQFTLSRRDVTVTGPDGVDVPVHGTQVTSTMRIGDFSTTSFASFSAPTAGLYTITISPGPGYQSPSSYDGDSTSVDIILTEGAELATFFTAVFGTIGLMFVGIGGLVVGGGLAIAGVIWWGVVRGRNKRIAAGGSGPYGGPGGPPYGGPGGQPYGGPGGQPYGGPGGQPYGGPGGQPYGGPGGQPFGAQQSQPHGGSTGDQVVGTGWSGQPTGPGGQQAVPPSPGFQFGAQQDDTTPQGGA